MCDTQKNYISHCNFVSNVYSNVLCQLLITISIVLLTIIPSVNNWLYILSVPLVPLLCVIVLLSQWAIINFGSNFDSSAISFIMLIFNIAIGSLVSFATLFISTNIILLSLCITTVVVMGLNYHAIATSYDYSPYYSYLVGLLFGLSSYALISYLFGMIQVGHISHSILYSVMYSGFIVYDTQQLIKNPIYYTIQNGEYIVAVQLYLDIIGLFINLSFVIKNLCCYYESKTDTVIKKKFTTDLHQIL